VLALLWYAPFYAWLGLLSTVFRRWSMPLAILIPGVLVLIENLFLRQSWNWGGHVLDYLRARLAFGLDNDALTLANFSPEPFAPLPLLSALVAGIDWVQMGLGIAVALGLVYLASEYRRRVLEK
jgi:ABC-2 type transport system permease protein